MFGLPNKEEREANLQRYEDGLRKAGYVRVPDILFDALDIGDGDGWLSPEEVKDLREFVKAIFKEE